MLLLSNTNHVFISKPLYFCYIVEEIDSNPVFVIVIDDQKISSKQQILPSDLALPI